MELLEGTTLRGRINIQSVYTTGYNAGIAAGGSSGTTYYDRGQWTVHRETTTNGIKRCTLTREWSATQSWPPGPGSATEGSQVRIYTTS